MPGRRARLLLALIVLLAGAGLTLAAGAEWRLYALATLLGLAAAAGISLLLAPERTADDDAEAARPETPLLQAAARIVDDSQAMIDARVLGAQYRREQRAGVEKVVDALLDDLIAMVRARLDVNTVAVFFPTNDGGYRIQRCSSRCEYVNRDAVIYPGVGVIGSFLKAGLKQLKLNEIVSDSKTLYYYTRDVGIRSVMGSPVVADGVERGWLIVDSTEPSFFTDDDHAYLSRAAAILSRTVYYAYLCTEYRLKHDRIVAMSATEKEFFTNLDEDAILDRLLSIAPFAVACDRISISLRSEDEPSASVRRAAGVREQDLTGLAFPLSSHGLVPLVYARNLCIFRSLTPGRYEPRYREDEPAHGDFHSFMAVPIGVDECRGVILIESLREDAYSNAHRDLLGRLAMSAGLALEKLRNLEQARALATHDGLTGLTNHRHFQELLQNHLQHAKRYGEPLSLVICDIDHFKKLNDTHGHPFGDVVLKGVAEQLRESIRTGSDVAARYGGEEFALILAQTDSAHAIETADRIRDLIANTPYRDPRGEEVRVTMSFGVASHGEHAANAAALIKRADQALYRAKDKGRNRVESF